MNMVGDRQNAKTMPGPPEEKGTLRGQNSGVRSNGLLYDSAAATGRDTGRRGRDRNEELSGGLGASEIAATVIVNDEIGSGMSRPDQRLPGDASGGGRLQDSKNGPAQHQQLMRGELMRENMLGLLNR